MRLLAVNLNNSVQIPEIAKKINLDDTKIKERKKYRRKVKPLERITLIASNLAREQLITRIC